MSQPRTAAKQIVAPRSDAGWFNNVKFKRLHNSRLSNRARLDCLTSVSRINMNHEKRVFIIYKMGERVWLLSNSLLLGFMLMNEQHLPFVLFVVMHRLFENDKMLFQTQQKMQFLLLVCSGCIFQVIQNRVSATKYCTRSGEQSLTWAHP